MIQKGLMYMVVFLNCFLIGCIVGTDCTADDFPRICKLTLIVQSVNVVMFIFFVILK